MTHFGCRNQKMWCICPCSWIWNHLWWVSSENMKFTLTKQKSLEWSNPKNIKSQVEIHVDSNIKYQKMLGLGSSFEHSTCYKYWNWNEFDKLQNIQMFLGIRTMILEMDKLIRILDIFQLKKILRMVFQWWKLLRRKIPIFCFLLILLDGWKVREIYSGGELLEKWYSSYALRYIYSRLWKTWNFNLCHCCAIWTWSR